MAKRTEKIFQSQSPKGRWITFDKGRDKFADMVKSGRAIRILHPNGNSKVIVGVAA
jgi:hypothetical protein